MLEAKGNLQAKELTRVLNISEDTVRRDLKKLAEEGDLTRVHGGALPRSRVPLHHSSRVSRSLESKRSIARKAISMIGPSSVVALDGGTTTLEIARLLVPQFKGTIVTNNLPAAIVLAENPNAEVIVIGGRLFKPALDTVGATLFGSVANMKFDYCFVGAASVDPGQGFGSLDYEEVQAKRALVKASTKVFCVASGEKIGTTSPFIFAPLYEISDVITDNQADATALRELEDSNIQIHMAN